MAVTICVDWNIFLGQVIIIDFFSNNNFLKSTCQAKL